LHSDVQGAAKRMDARERPCGRRYAPTASSLPANW